MRVPGSTPTGWQRRKFGHAPFEHTIFSYARTAPSIPARAERLQSGAIGSTSPTSVIWTTTRASVRPTARRSLRVSVPRGHRRPRDSDVDTLKVDATMAQDGRVDQEVPGMMSCIVFGTAPGAA